MSGPLLELFATNQAKAIEEIASLPWHTTPPNVYLELLPVVPGLLVALKESEARDDKDAIVFALEAVKNIAQHKDCKGPLVFKYDAITVIVPLLQNKYPSKIKAAAANSLRHIGAIESSTSTDQEMLQVVEILQKQNAINLLLQVALDAKKKQQETSSEDEELNTDIAYASEALFRLLPSAWVDGIVANVDVLGLIMPFIVTNLLDGDKQQKKRASALFKTFARYASPELKKKMIESYKIIPGLVSCLSSANRDVRSRCAMGIWLMVQASHGANVKEAVLSSGAISLLLQDFDIYEARGALQCISSGSQRGVYPLIQGGAVTACRNYLQKNPSDTYTCLLLSNLIGKQEAAEFKLDDQVIAGIIKHFLAAYNNRSLMSRSQIPNSTAMESIHITEILWVMSNLAINPNNQARIAKEEVIASLKRLLFDKKLAAKYCIVVVRVMGHLVFYKNSHPFFMADDGLNTFKKLLTTETDRDILAGVSGIVWELNQSAATPQTQPQQQQQQQQQSKQKIMMSYSWSTQDIVVKVAAELRQQGFEIWMDIDKMSGDIMAAMADAVDNSYLVCAAVSRGYHDSANCKRELAYAFRKQKPVIFFLVDEDYVVDGWLGLYIGDSLFVDFRSKTESGFQSGVKNLCHQLRLTIEGKEKKPAGTPPATATTSSSSPTASSSTMSLSLKQPVSQEQLDRIEKKLDEQNELLQKILAFSQTAGATAGAGEKKKTGLFGRK